MKKENKKRNGWNGLLSFIITVLCWMPLFIDEIFPLATLMISIGIELACVIFVLLIVFAVVTSIIIHEAGHLVFGLLSGYGFCSFRIFSIMWIKTDDGIKVKRYSVPGTAGQCLLTPPEIKDGKMPTVIYNLGGSLLGLIAAVIFAMLAYLMQNHTIAYMMLVLLTATNLTAALTNGIPMRTAMLNNDGKNAVSLRKNPKAAAAFRMQLMVNAESSKDIPITEMPEEWFVMPNDEDMSDSMLVSQACLCFERSFNCGKYIEAKEIARKILSSDSVIGLHRASILMNLAFIHIILGENDDARRIFKKEYHKNSNLYSRSVDVARTRYAYELLVKGSEKGARRELCIFNMLMRKLKKYPFKSTLDQERTLIEKVDSLYEQRKKLS